MKLKQLLQGMEVRGSKEIEITGLSSDSRVTSPGHLFIAKKQEYIQQAIDAGARAVVTDVYDPFLPVSQVICPHPGKVEALLASKYYGKASEKLFVVGVTGTKGKTTTSYLIHHLLGKSCGLVGTVETIVGQNRGDSSLTTHGAIFNQKILKQMLNEGCKSAVLEVSSHGLDQGRVDEIAFDVGVFTNLHPDHLDYHKTVEHYVATKAKLFTKCDSIVNGDSPWAHRMEGRGKCLRFGIENDVDVRAKDLVLSEEGVQFVVGGTLFRSPLLGLFNVYNLLGAISVGVFMGKSLEEMASSLVDFSGVPGRLQRVLNPRGVHVFVDYAHTGESLESVLKTLKAIAKKRLIVVFGCGGNRDPGRRKEMALAAEKWADVSIVTTDNPRNEDPEAIAREILEGFSSLKNVMVILDRKEAILKAVQMANPGDFVLIAGKGHEKIQIFSRATVTFDDVLVATEAG